MSHWPITFISGQWKLIENPRRQCASLREAWRILDGTEPDISVDGSTVVGVHAPEQSGVRSLRFMWGGNPRAVEHAATLIGLKYGVAVEVRGWLKMTERPDQWIPDVNPRPFDLSALMVWPKPAAREVKDSVVLELRGRPGHFIGRNPPTVARVADALRFPSPGFAHQCMRIRGISRQAVQPKWRAAAIAEEDQRLAEIGS